MDWELIGKIALGILTLLSVASITFFKIRNNKKLKKNSQKIKGNSNIQAGGNVTIEKGINDE